MRRLPLVQLDHTFSYLRDNDLENARSRFARAGFDVGEQRVRHSRGQLTGFAHLTGSYLEFISVVDEAEFEREANMADRIYRMFPQPYGVAFKTRDANAVHATLSERYANVPAVYHKAAVGLQSQKPAWSFCFLPQSAFPGTFAFAIQYYGKRRRKKLRQGPNTIFALGGVVFCTERIEEHVSAWKAGLGKVAHVAHRGARLLANGHSSFEWISPAQFRERHGCEYHGSGDNWSNIASIRLLASDVKVACRMLSAEGFELVRESRTVAHFAPDPVTGYTFEVVKGSPAKHLRSLSVP